MPCTQKHTIAVLLLLCFTLSACRQNDVKPTAEADTLHLKHARLLTFIRHADHDEVLIWNPWQAGKVLHRYLLVPREQVAGWPKSLDATIVGVPVERSVVFTASHAYLLYNIGATDCIAGVCDWRYMHSPAVVQRLNAGLAVDCGDGMHPNLERIVQSHADALFLSPFEHSGGYGAVEKLGIPLIECADYMEQSALGRAEWMKFYGMLVGRTQQADSLFAVVEHNYYEMKDKVKQSKRRPLMLTERKTGGVWYCPGGNSTMSAILRDAHATHLLAADKHSGSVPLSPEEILMRGQEVDCWTFHADQTQHLSYGNLLEEWHGYGQIKAFQQRNVYVCNSSTSAYFDEIAFRPDYLLHEFIVMLHPDVFPTDTLRYYEKL